MGDSLKSNAPYALIPAALMLYFGWMVVEPWSQPDSFLQTTGNILCWTLRYGGIAMLVVAVLYFAGVPVTRVIDAAVSGGCGAVLVFCGAYGIIKSGFTGLQSILYVIFGLMFIRDAVRSWRNHLAAASMASTDTHAQFARPAMEQSFEPAHPASIRPASLSGSDEQPPPEGYLAAMSKDDDKPPTASYE